MQRAVPTHSGAGNSSYSVMPSNTAISNFSNFAIGPRQNWFISRFRRRCSLWCSTDSCGHIFFIIFWLFHLFSAYLWIKHRNFRTLLTLDNYRYQTHERNITKFYLLIPKHLIMQLTKLQSLYFEFKYHFLTLQKKIRLPLNKGVQNKNVSFINEHKRCYVW